jgi:archaemetzincin
MKKLFAFLVLILISCSEKPTDKNTVVAILPYKGLSSEKSTLIKNAIEGYYKVTVKIFDESLLPEEAFTKIKSHRYRADSLIIIQQRNIPDGIDYVIGLTTNDISVTKRDNTGKIKKPEWKYNDFGIMGLAYCPGKSCIVSDFRLKHKDKAIQFGRFKKVAIHELGHNFGLPHCPDKNCVMTDAVEKIITIDNAKPELCSKCKAKLK